MSQSADPAPRCVLWLTEFSSPLPAAWVEQRVQCLCASEAQRLARIRRALRREQFVVGHVLLRQMLRSLGVADPIIEMARNGQPYMADSEGVNLSTARPDLAPALLAVRLCTGPLLGATSGRSRRNLHTLSEGFSPAGRSWHVSLAHSAGAVAALASTEPAGVDIEVQRTLRDPAGVVALLGQPCAARLPAGADLSELALKSWVASEARTKAGRAEANARDEPVTWLALRNSCWIAVAGTAASPQTFVSDLLRDTYNPVLQIWTAVP